MNPHEDLAYMRALTPFIRDYQALAVKHGVPDIFQDNGGKTLEVVLSLGLKIVPGRAGSDVEDDDGNQYELKTLNLATRARGFCSCHHLHLQSLVRFRKEKWLFVTYDGIEILEAYTMRPEQLESYFSKWEEKIKTAIGGIINNPKIHLAYVKQHGNRVL